jgi:uncharacterized OB-fold protein
VSRLKRQQKNISARIAAYRCTGGHVFLHAHDRCPVCKGKLEPGFASASAVLIVHTTVYINPTGIPVTLGIARTRCKAQTLCIVKSKIRGNGRDRVVLFKLDNRYYAVKRAGRAV